MKTRENWERCPLCKSTDLDSDPVVINNGEVSQDVWCLTCDSAWIEIYKQNERVMLINTKGVSYEYC